MGSHFDIQGERLGFLEVESGLLVQTAYSQLGVIQRDSSPQHGRRVGYVHPPPTDTPGGESSERLVNCTLGKYGNDKLRRKVGDGCWSWLGGLGGNFHVEGVGRNLGDKGQN